MNKETDILSQTATAEAPISERLAAFAVGLDHDAYPGRGAQPRRAPHARRGGDRSGLDPL